MSNQAIKRLAAAVLEQALKDYEAPLKADIDKAKKLKHNFEDARNWFDEKSRKPMGFYWCLEISETNPNLVRKFLDDCDAKYNKIKPIKHAI